MKSFTTAVMLFAISTPALSAATGTVFNADTSCQFSQTLAGPRYSVPCNFDTQQLTPVSSTELDPTLPIANIDFQQKIKIDFKCESLKTLDVTYSVGPNQRGSLNPSPLQPSLDLTFKVTKDASPLTITVKTPPGMQVFKPGCVIQVLEHFKTIDDKAIDLYYSLNTRVKSTLERSFASLTPDAGATQLIGSIDQAVSLLDFLAETADEISREQIQTIIGELEAQKSAVSQSCGAGSDAELCTAGLAAARIAIDAELKQLNTEIGKVDSYIKSEIERLKVEVGAQDLRNRFHQILLKYKRITASLI